MFLRSTSRVTALFLLALAAPLQAQDSGRAPAFSDDELAGQLSPDMYNATTIWDNACAACHGELGQGGPAGTPDIRNTPLSLSQIMQVVKAGRNTMPAFAGFTAQELLDVSTYVLDAL